MKFRTEIEPLKGRVPIEHRQALLTMGSCFAQNMAQKLSAVRFRVRENPFGVLYNPASVLAALQLINGERLIAEEDLVFHNGLWHSLLHHSIFSDVHKNVLLARIEEVNAQTREYLKEANHVILTLGTAFVYRFRASGKIAANCHKIPAEQFERFRLTADEVRAAVSKSIELLRKSNPALHIIITVSPIRHIKEGLVQNQLSKATLITGIHEAVQDAGPTDYFPAYEIMMDDLRGYRFYEENLTHPNAMAQNYIWQKFTETFFSTGCRHTVTEMENLQKALNHRPLHARSQAHLEFVRRELQRIKHLARKYPYLDFSAEEAFFKKQLQ